MRSGKSDQNQSSNGMRQFVVKADGTLAAGQPVLPGKAELQQILASESYRNPAPGKEAIHYPDFSTIGHLLAAYGQKSDLFEADERSIEEILLGAPQVINGLAERITATVPSSLQSQRLAAAYNYLCEEDSPAKSDIIFVFGSKTMARIDKAIELYKAGLSEFIMVSGGAPIYDSQAAESEAARFKAAAVKAGVPKNAVITEDRSITIADNVRSSLNALDSLGIEITSMTLVISPYAMRRAYTTMQKYTPDSMKLTRISSSTLPEYRPDAWFTDLHATTVILNEFAKMRASNAYNSS